MSRMTFPGSKYLLLRYGTEDASHIIKQILCYQTEIEVVMDSIMWFKNAAKQPPASSLHTESASYDRLLQSDGDSISEDDKTSMQWPLPDQQKSRSRLHSLISVFAKLLVLALAVWGLLNVCKYTLHALKPAKNVSCSCGGTTVAEAKARGCVFTPLAISWLPPHCIDFELATEFDNAGPAEGWPYWADVNGTIPMTREEVGLLADTKDGVFYTTQEWHVKHCMFTWRKHFRSKTNGVTVENRSNGLEHIEHCEKIATADHPMKEIWTMAGIELNADLV